MNNSEKAILAAIFIKTLFIVFAFSSSYICKCKRKTDQTMNFMSVKKSGVGR